jgi:fructokinase
VRVVDTVGAGDAFSAVAIAAHLAGGKCGPALALANRFAAAICGVRGPLPQHGDFFESLRFMLGQTEAKK